MAKPKDLKALIEVTKTTQTLLSHFQTSLLPSAVTPPPQSPSTTSTLLNPLDVVKAATTLLKSHTTTLSLLLINPPLTPSALIAKIGDVSSGALSGLVAAASYVPQAGAQDNVGDIMRTELKSQIWRLLGTWGDILALVLRIAETRQDAQGKDTGPTESEKQDVLSATGVLWEACDTLLKMCDDGIVGLVVKKAQEFRAVLLDAVEELKEWGEDAEEDGDDAETSDDEDDIFGAENKLGKDDTVLRQLLDTSIKKLKMVSMLYQALLKRRLKTYPTVKTAMTTMTNGTTGPERKPAGILDELMVLLKSIPESVDDLASAFYDLDEDGVKETLQKCCTAAKTAADLVKQNWTDDDDEFTAWSNKWVAALDAA